MSALAKEVRALQNPALGAALLWAFANAYSEAHPTRAGTPLPLLFVVLPLVLQEQTRSVVLSTRKTAGLRSFSEKFSSSKMAKADVVLTLQAQVVAMKQLSMDSLRLMLAYRLASVDASTASIIPSTVRTFPRNADDAVDELMRAANYLGRWTGGLSLYEVATTLRLLF